jgi:RNA polymerase sigma factor (sigma-70 family)
MSRFDYSAPRRQAALGLHGRLLASDPVAPSELARAYVPHLCVHLAARFPGIDPDLRQEAAHEAVVTLAMKPESFDPRRGSDLAAYLRRAAECDLKNRLRRERRHRHCGLEAVEQSPRAGKYLGQGDEPLLRLVRTEQCQEAEAILAAVRARLSEPERRALDLMLDGEKRTEAFAAVLGLSDRPRAEQERAVKRVKDRIKKRIERAGGEP